MYWDGSCKSQLINWSANSQCGIIIIPEPSEHVVIGISQSDFHPVPWLIIRKHTSHNPTLLRFSDSLSLLLRDSKQKQQIVLLIENEFATVKSNIVSR